MKLILYNEHLNLKNNEQINIIICVNNCVGFVASPTSKKLPAATVSIILLQFKFCKFKRYTKGEESQMKLSMIEKQVSAFRGKLVFVLVGGAPYAF